MSSLDKNSSTSMDCQNGPRKLFIFKKTKNSRNFGLKKNIILPWLFFVFQQLYQFILSCSIKVFNCRWIALGSKSVLRYLTPKSVRYCNSYEFCNLLDPSKGDVPWICWMNHEAIITLIWDHHHDSSHITIIIVVKIRYGRFHKRNSKKKIHPKFVDAWDGCKIGKSHLF